VRHRKSGRKLGRDASHRKALYANLTGALIEHGRIKTTVTKAKAVKPIAERMITLGRRGDLHARRQAVAFLRSLPGLAPERIFIIGHSEGGTLAPLVAARTSAIAGVAIVNSVQFPVDELLVAQLQANPTVPKGTVDEVKRSLMKIRDGSFPKRGLLFGAGAEYWTQWIRYSQHSRTMLSELSIPMLLVQSLADETLPGETLGRNLENLRSVVAVNKNAQLRELRAHDHFGMLPGGRDPSPEFTRVLLDWLNNAARAAQPGAAADAPQAARR
jgi:large subunit ribosomal protein L17